jgi:y4mF family transcriptional regulator
MAMTYDNFISNFVKYNRSKLQMTQEELAEKAGVGLRFIRELEQGKETLRMDKVNQVLQLFGYTLSPGPGRKKDPYEILLNHTNRNVHIFLKNKTVLVGFIVDQIIEGNEIKAWKFVSNNNSVEYRKTENQELLTIIKHDEIENVENI